MSLAELIQEFLDDNQWSTIGDIEVYLVRDDQLRTGVFGVASRMQSDAPPRRRPYDSLSLPAPNGSPASYAPPPPQRPDPQHSPLGDQFRQPAAVYQPDQPAPPARERGSAPARPRSGAALVIDQSNQRFELRVGSNVVGRGTDADIQLLDQGVSRRHLDVQFDGRHATVYDLGSTNGTNVNGHDVGSSVLRHGDVLRIGHTRLVFSQADG
jgi:hypothetical protein